MKQNIAQWPIINLEEVQPKFARVFFTAVLSCLALPVAMLLGAFAGVVDWWVHFWLPCWRGVGDE